MKKIGKMFRWFRRLRMNLLHIRSIKRGTSDNDCLYFDKKLK